MLYVWQFEITIGRGNRQIFTVMHGSKNQANYLALAAETVLLFILLTNTTSKKHLKFEILW